MGIKIESHSHLYGDVFVTTGIFLSSPPISLLGEKANGRRLDAARVKQKMPCLNISTNVNLEGVDTSAILSEASKAVSNIIGKPEAYVMVVLKGSIPISFGGTQQPAAYGELVSIGGLNPDVNKKLSAEIATILENKLSIPKSRYFLKFYDSKALQPREYAQCLHALHQQ
ncbi:macrophage migration inhibitory factor [Canna indica]|uniref:Macrophage migration inhibitory factor n=1 Tax=Canna indica TaxID=4628 RepID=A0AAQ3Q3Q4_9LILI|nr:macrophage migration inhibitory factor [Canna indica]